MSYVAVHGMFCGPWRRTLRFAYSGMRVSGCAESRERPESQQPYREQLPQRVELRGGLTERSGWIGAIEGRHGQRGGVGDITPPTVRRTTLTDRTPVSAP